MSPRHGGRARPVPVWKLRRWLPAVLAGAAGLGGVAAAQPPADPPKAERPKADDKKPADAAKPDDEKRYGISWDKKPWEDVFDWYGKETGLILVTSVRPSGSVTIKPPPGVKLTLGEITDYLNEQLIPQKFVIIRYNTSFTVWPADLPLDPTRIPRVDAAELARRGKSEIVLANVGPLKAVSAADVFPAVEKMLTPQFGKAVLLEQANTIQVVDTAENIRRIKKTVEDDASGPSDTLVHVCKYRAAGEVAAKLKELLTDKDTQVGGTAAAPAPGGFGPGGGFGQPGGFFPGGGGPGGFG
ncbi:MAG: hypothetical protein K2X82_10645, partial [Gemmataceae bacterium]|nr:hypothetical protein [Gemmataceae bacterium]